MKVINVVQVIVLFLIVFGIMYWAMFKFPWLGDRLLNKMREFFGIPMDDLAILLHLDESAAANPGESVIDSSGWNNYAVFGNPHPWWGTQEGETVIWGPSSLVFDDPLSPDFGHKYIEVQNDPIKLPNFSRLGPSSITIDFWIRLISSPDYHTWVYTNILSKGTSPPSYQVKITEDDKITIIFRIMGAGKSFTTDTSLHVGTRAGDHVAITYNDATGKAKVFINGVEDKNSILFGDFGSGGIEANNENLRIGSVTTAPCDSGAGGCSPHAIIDEIRIYNKVLSTSEIVAHYQNIY
jgi:hypothetical protein